MKALALKPGTTDLRLVDRPEPKIADPHDVKVQILEVGICGTDREEAKGGRCKAPPGSDDLVIGHESFGRVVEVGSAVTGVAVGDHAVFVVRRPCPTCMPCAMRRQDMCVTGDYTERGIWGRDGFQAEFVVDREDYVVKAPPGLESVGVLTEPLSVAEKAIDAAVRAQLLRLPDAGATPDWLHGRTCLVAGLGPVGLLAALAMRLRGATVFGMDIVDAGTARPKWLEAIGGTYVDGRACDPSAVEPMELIVEATGVPALEFELVDALAPSGVYVLTGIPGGDRLTQLHAAALVRRVVLNNQVLLGSVNAARDHYVSALDDLAAARCTWGDHAERLITHRVPRDRFASVIREHPAGEIKATVTWA